MKIVSIYKDIKSIPDLKQRIIYTLMLLAVFRFGSFVILPGVDSSTLMALFNMSQGEGILGLLNTFVGGAFARGSIFSLGIMPYISASIIMQLMATALPSLRKLQEQENGQRKINQYTRLATIGITLFQSIAAAINLQTQYPSAIYISGFTFILTTVFCMVAGTMFLVWLGERITDNGIGNGVSLIIAVGIISELPIAMLNEIKSSPIMLFYAELIALGIVTMGVILLTQGTRNIPINYAKRMVGGGKVAGGMMNTIKSSIPLKVNSAGVMPIIFAQAIMFIPAQISLFFQDSDFWIATGSSLNNPNSIIYNLIFIFLIIVFTYFYNTIVIDSNKIAENLKTNNGFIPGIKQGKETANFIDSILSRITLPGALFLAFVAILPTIVVNLGVSSQFAQFFGGTSLLIMISVVLETINQIDSYLLSNNKEGIIAKKETQSTKFVASNLKSRVTA